MSTVTPVSSNDTQRLQQEIMSEASRAFQILLENLKEEWKRSTYKEETEQEQTKENIKDKVKITIGGQEKDANQLTWEDYGKLQALTQKNVGDNSPDLANIKVVHKTPVEEKTLLETNDKGKVITNTLKTPYPPNITATQAVSKALNKLDDSPVKDYLIQVNQQLSQQLQQQQRLLEESQRINQQLSQQLNYSQSLNQESQKINQQQVKLLQNYQQLQQVREKKDPQGWQKLGTQLKNKIGQLWSSLNQWWQQRKQNLKQQNEDKQLAGNLRYFARQILKTSDHKSQISGDKYNIEKQGDIYQIKSKEGAVLMKFQDKGVLGTKVLESNLSIEQKKDISELGNFRKDSSSLSNNSQLFSRNVSSSLNSITESPELTNNFKQSFQGLKYIVNQKGSDINEINRGGFDIQTTNQGKDIMLSRSNNGQLVASKSQNGQIMIPSTSTVDDANNLQQIVNKALDRLSQQTSNSSQSLETNTVQTVQSPTPQSSSSTQPTPLLVNEFSRKFLEPIISDTSHQYVTTGFDKEIGHYTQDVPSEITLAVHNHLFRINDNYPPQSGEVALIARELDNFSVLAVANSAKDDRDRPLVNYRYFWLKNSQDNPNFDGIATLLNWWSEKGQPSPQLQSNSDILVNLENNKNTNFYNVSQIQETIQRPPLSRDEILKIDQDDSIFGQNYHNLHDLASRQSQPHEKVSWAWNVTKLEEPDQFLVTKSPQSPLYFPESSKQRNLSSNPQDYHQHISALKSDFQTIFEKLQKISQRMNRPINGIYRDYKIETNKNGNMKISRKSNPFVKLAEYKNGTISITNKATSQDIKALKEMVNQASKALNHQSHTNQGQKR